MSDLQQEMEAFFSEYEERWNDQDDFSSLIEMWDTDQPPYYRPIVLGLPRPLRLKLSEHLP